MTKKRKLKPIDKMRIAEEAGGKCANPGCSNWRTHIHHIKHWAIYESDDPEILIAVCPSCHDAIHHGSLEFNDDILYQWKNIIRPKKPSYTHIDVEPSKNIKLLTGSIAIATTNSEVSVFELSEHNKLGFRILDDDLHLSNLKISDLSGAEKIKVTDNHVRVHDNDTLVFEQVPGHIKVSTQNANSFISAELVEKMKIQQPNFLLNGELILLEMQVLKPGLIKIKGCWADNERAVIITDDALTFITPGMRCPLIMKGAGENSVIVHSRSINLATLGFKDTNTSLFKM